MNEIGKGRVKILKFDKFFQTVSLLAVGDCFQWSILRGILKKKFKKKSKRFQKFSKIEKRH